MLDEAAGVAAVSPDEFQPGRKGKPKGFTWQDNRDLIVRAHNQLKGPIVLVWDNLRTYLMPQMKDFISLPTHPTSTRRKASGHW
ncbi:hypothetical protein [Streptomyces sp900116325]|uniref:hypothetical protein n=1 Tax=Streptomyces sp. 900116325 TaxID=3154295 RepID=UPI00332DF2A8